MQGKVSIVGAGPGDPELLTRKAERLLREADAVLYDRLISEEILALVPTGIARIFAGKSCKQHHMTQEEINQTLVELARNGKHIVRLKGGDPFIFGRGGEEAEALAAANIPFEIVPGISAASGCSAYAGIPLTHRDYASGVRYITGHLKAEALAEMDWQSLAEPNTTLVVYMGLANAETVSRELIKHGLPTRTPAAAIQQGTTAQQKIVTTTLQNLPNMLQQQEFISPTLLVIGKVAVLSQQLSWFTTQPSADAPAKKHAQPTQ